MSGSFGTDGLRCAAPTSAGHGSVRCFVDGDVEDAAVLAERFAHDRDGVLGSLRGRFAVVVWDADTGEGIVAVDPLASRPLYYREASRTLRFAGELRDLVEALPATPGPSAAALRRWLEYGVLEPHEALYDGINRLPGGHYLQLSRAGWRLSRYWRPVYREPLQVSHGEAAELIRAEIGRAVAERRTGRAGVMLSGGLDSASIAALAGGDLGAYSSIFPEYPEADETDLVVSTAAALSLPSTRRIVRGEGVLAAAREHTREWRVPPVSPTLFFQLPLIRLAADEGIEVLFDGEGGDELFGCSPYLLADEVRRLRLRSARRLATRLPGFGPEADPPLVAAAVRRFGVRAAMPAWVHRVRPGDRSRWEWKRLDGPRWWASLADQLTAGRERALAHEYLRRTFASAGVVGAHPYFDDLGLIELILRLPPALSFDPVFDRPLLREAVRGLIPERVRLRVDKSTFDAPVVGSLAGPDFETVRGLLDPADARVRAYVAAEALAQVTGMPVESRNRFWARAAFRLASVELWLRLLDGEDA